MARAKLCDRCLNVEACKDAGSYCNAMNELFHVYDDSKKQIAQTFINEHRRWLSIVDAEQCTEYEQIASRVIDANGVLGKEIPLTEVDEWKNLEPELLIDKVEKPLFGYFKMPYNNTIDYNSPEGVAVFHNCLQELRALDMPDKCKAFFFTFASGEDFFVEGDTSSEEQTEDFFAYMKEKYDNCFKVTNVDRYELIPHLEVGGA